MFNSVSSERQSQIATVTLVLLAFLSLFFLVKTVNEWKRGRVISDETAMYTTIQVQGEGEINAQPNIAEVYFGVSERASTASAAQEALTAKMNTVFSALQSIGIEEKDVKTSGYNVYPRYEYQEIRCLSYPCPQGSDRIVGYEASHNVTITIRNLDTTGEVLGVLGGLNVTNISGPTLTFDDDSGLLREARQEAIRDAQEKASQLASDLGVKLVRIVGFQESGNGYMPYYDKAGYGRGGVAVDMMESVPSVPVGENTLTSYVTITYQIR